MFTKTTLFHKPNEGGGSGGDQHNLGWYATPEALRTAHATATAGDWAIVGSTDTVWIWDTDTNAWKDSDQKGQVASVNGQTGTVVLTASDVGAATAAQGALADTAVQPSAIADMETQTHASATYATKSELADKQDVIQYSAIPTASADNVGDIVQFVGTTTASYTNGYFYKCVSDGQNPATYSWEEVEVQASSGGGLPDQTGMSGRFLTTDGSSASWSNQLRFDYSSSWLSVQSPVVLKGSNGVGLGDSYGVTLSGSSVAIGSRAKAASSYGGIAIGYITEATGNDAISIGWATKATADYAIQIGGWGGVNSDANTFKVANNNGNFEIMSADGTIPEARLADTTNATQGDVLTLDANLNAVWSAGGSGGGVSDVTVNGTSVVSGGVAAITGMVQNMAPSNYQSNSFALYPFNLIYNGSQCVSIGTPNSACTPTGNRAVCIGGEALSNSNSVALGYSAHADANGAVSIGCYAFATGNRSIQLGGGISTSTGYTNSDANTFKVGNANGNFEMMSADGTIPEARLADTTNATSGQVLTLDSNLNAVWATGGGADPHRVIDFQAPTAQNNYTWYRKYADGWVEQGGVYTGSVSAGNSVAITLAVTMSDTNYTLNITGEQNSNNYSYAVIKDGSKTTTGFSLFAGGGSGGDSINAACWQVSGMAS